MIALFNIGNCNAETNTTWFAPISFKASKIELQIIETIVRCGLEVSEVKANNFIKPSLVNYRFIMILRSYFNYQKIYNTESHAGLCISVRRIFLKRLRGSRRKFQLMKDQKANLQGQLRQYILFLPQQF